MDTQFGTYGNLALAPHACEYGQLNVIDGMGRRSHGSLRIAVSRPTQEQLLAPDSFPRTTAKATTLPRAFICTALLAVLVCCCTFIIHTVQSYRIDSHQKALSSITYESVHVQPGESLWSLAEDHSVDGMATAEVADAIKLENNLSSGMLKAGMELMVPRAS